MSRTALFSVTLTEENGVLYMVTRRRSRILLETPVLFAPTWSSKPVISSLAKEGVTATFVSGVYNGLPSPTVSYRWKLDGAVVGEQDTPYTPISGDVGKTLTVTQTATNSEGSTDKTSDGLTVAAASVDPDPGDSIAHVTGPTEITFVIETAESIYAGVEWGISPAYTWSAFDAELGTSHSMVIGSYDGVAAATTYAYRPYVTNDPLDSIANRTYGTPGTITTP